MLHKVAYDEGVHCLPLTQLFLETATDSKTDLFKFKNKYGKDRGKVSQCLG